MRRNIEGEIKTLLFSFFLWGFYFFVEFKINISCLFFGFIVVVVVVDVLVVVLTIWHGPLTEFLDLAVVIVVPLGWLYFKWWLTWELVRQKLYLTDRTTNHPHIVPLSRIGLRYLLLKSLFGLFPFPFSGTHRWRNVEDYVIIERLLTIWGENMGWKRVSTLLFKSNAKHSNAPFRTTPSVIWLLIHQIIIRFFVFFAPSDQVMFFKSTIYNCCLAILWLLNLGSLPV